MDRSNASEPSSTPPEGTATGTPDVASDVTGASASTAGDLPRQLEEQRDRHLRLAAEFDNFRKRTVRERQEAGWRAQADLVAGLLEVLDDLSRFAQVDPASTETGTVVDGVAMVERKLFKSLSGHGLEIVNPMDRPFDPSVHEAISTTPAASADEDHLVAQVFQPGYLFRGQLLRPARVVVKQWNA